MDTMTPVIARQKIRIASLYKAMVMNVLKIFVTGCVFLVSCPEVQCQQVAIAAGGNINTGEGSISYSVGQVVDGSITFSGYSIIEGVQQPYELFLVSSTKETDIRLSLSPNPALDFVVLKTDKMLDKMVVRLFTTDGKEVFSQPVEETETLILLESIKGSAYFLVIYADTFPIKSFTLLKQ